MKRYQKRIILAAAIILVLIAAFVWGGQAPETAVVSTSATPAAFTATPAASTATPGAASPAATPAPEESPAVAVETIEEKGNFSTPQPTLPPAQIEETRQIPEQPAPPQAEQSATSVTEETALPEQSPQPEKEETDSEEMTCTLSIRCDSILNNLDLLEKEKWELVPENGVILEEVTVPFYEGETVFHVLLRETKKNKIHFEFVNTPVYNSAYIEGIGNLYEFDCGELSGWMYCVNGWYPNYGCSRYKLKDGDKIQWNYTCNLGEDIGGYNDLSGEENR